MAGGKVGSKSAIFPVTIFAHLLVIAITILVLVWLFQFREGLAFKSRVKAKIFNVHPLLMVIGFILLAGEAILSYKSVPAEKKGQKIFHLTLHTIALVAGIVGIYAVFKFHDELHIPHMYTLHSWFGISTICLFGLQWLFGFVSFVFPRAQSSTRARIAPWHIFLGVVIFFLAILTAEIGIAEKFIFIGLRRSQEALIVNFTGLLLFIFAVTVGYGIILSPRK